MHFLVVPQASLIFFELTKITLLPVLFIFDKTFGSCRNLLFFIMLRCKLFFVSSLLSECTILGAGYTTPCTDSMCIHKIYVHIYTCSFFLQVSRCIQVLIHSPCDLFVALLAAVYAHILYQCPCFITYTLLSSCPDFFNSNSLHEHKHNFTAREL